MALVASGGSGELVGSGCAAHCGMPRCVGSKCGAHPPVQSSALENFGRRWPGWWCEAGWSYECFGSTTRGQEMPIDWSSRIEPHLRG